MNKETFQQRKMEALCNNMEAFQHDLLEEGMLFENPGQKFVEQQDSYSRKSFESTERLIGVLVNQGRLRTISSSHRVFHELHVIRNFPINYKR